MKPKRLLVWLIALCMVLTLTPVTSFANEAATEPQNEQIGAVENTEPAEQSEEVEQIIEGSEEETAEDTEQEEVTEKIEEVIEEPAPEPLRAAAAAPTEMWVEPSETNNIPAQIDVFKAKTGGTNNNPTYTYQLYLPGNANLDNSLLFWTSF